MVKLSDAIQKLTLSILVQLLYQIQLYTCHGPVNYQIIMMAYITNLTYVALYGVSHFHWLLQSCTDYFVLYLCPFLQRVSIACYAERCISHSKSVLLSVRLSVCPLHAGTESKRLKLRSWGLHWRIAP